MKVEHVEVIVEEPSMEMALRTLLLKMIGSMSFEVYSHQGKGDLVARLPERLRGYASWLPRAWRIVVIVDRDDEDCVTLKTRLDKIAAAAGLHTRSSVRGESTYSVVNRIAVEELEAWYFGDWEAVRMTYPRVPATITDQRKYRDPDAIAGGTWQAFERVLQQAGYFSQGLAKIEAARAISTHMSPERNQSRSFQALRNALREMVTYQPHAS